MIGGFLGMVIANGSFPLLDRDAFLITGLCVLLAPVMLQLVSSFRKRLALDLGRLQRAYLSCGVVAILLAAMMACNGALDQSPVTPVRTVLLRKQVTRGKSGPSYMLTLRSWRAGRATETLGVNGRTYGTISTEKGVVVQMHSGRFGLPWYSGVLSE